jgi:2-polyprenyl-3-methyl-5-hydroxy-6-metoxy-1,4-benzoquinol methylase
MWKRIRTIAKRRKLGAIRVLDVACGAGDFAIWLKRQSSACGLKLLIEGCDISPLAVEFAAQRAAADAASVRFFQCDALHDRLDAYDIVTCSLFLHHLDDAQAVRLLIRLASAAQLAVLIDDLRRTVLGLALARLGCAVLTRSPVVHVDAPLSVRAAFTEAEVERLLNAAEWRHTAIRRHWPQRFLITLEKPWMASTP